MAPLRIMAVLAALCGIIQADPCPFEPRCDCTDNPYPDVASGEGKLIDCRNLGLTSVPEGINTWNADQVTAV